MTKSAPNDIKITLHVSCNEAKGVGLETYDRRLQLYGLLVL